MDKNQTTSVKFWTFEVKYEPKHSEKVCITGDCKSLGNWNIKKIIPLTYEASNKLWTVRVSIPADRDVHYRYFTCSVDFINDEQKTKVLQWETNFSSRKIKREQLLKDGDNECEIFGMFDNIEKLENGWLTDDVAVYVRLTSNSIQWIPEEKVERKTFIKLKRSQQGQNHKNSNNQRSSDTILISTRNEDGKFHEQSADGYSYYDTEQAVFMTRTFAFDNQGFVFEFVDIVEGQSVRNCYSYLVLENKFHGSTGSIKIPIHSSDHEHLGNLNVKYLIVRPLMPSVECTLKSSYAKYWNNSWTGLEIGHRGSGVSFSNSTETNAKCRENTIGSFKSAGKYGAHLVEFDVQLTNDLVPTIYHDFHVLLEVQNRIEKSKRKMILPFHKLNFEELKDFKIHHLKELNNTFSFENDDEEEYSPFPSLEQVLNSVDPHIGFNIEIKYTSQLQDGSNELDYPIDMNDYVDKILEVVFANANRRYIVFSSFSPDICIMY